MNYGSCSDTINNFLITSLSEDEQVHHPVFHHGPAVKGKVLLYKSLENDATAQAKMPHIVTSDIRPILIELAARYSPIRRKHVSSLSMTYQVENPFNRQPKSHLGEATR